MKKIRATIHRWLNRRGYTLTPTGRGFIDAKTTVAAARRSGLSVCEYRESLEDDPRKRGRRDRIIAELQKVGALHRLEHVCEIGAGTGQYLELIFRRAGTYEVYETDPGWREFLRSEYGSGPAGSRLVCHAADGASLQQTQSASCDLVHAHAVFVYLPLLQTMEYLLESVRVCRNGGMIVFDCFLDADFSSIETVAAWLRGPYRFPVVVPEKLLASFAMMHRLEEVHRFQEVYGAGMVTYFVWRRGD